MDKQSIEHHLKEINLNLDSQTINNSSNFMINEIGFISDIEIEYQTFSALAIVSQLGALQNADHYGFPKNGIRIQNVMSHLGKLSKERFLDTLNKQLQKLKRAPQSLKKRVEDIRYSYRFYKKYQTTFQALFQGLLPNRSCKQQFCALFWVLYLYIKNINVQTQNISEAKCLMILMFRIIFEESISQADFNDIFPIMEQKIGAIPQISIDKQDYYFLKIKQKMDYFYSQRFAQSETNFKKLLDNYTYVQRLVDDMSNAYVNQQTTLRYYNQIDELSYLQLKKNLTPQVFRRVIPAAHIQMMCKPLSFDDDGDDQFGGPIEEEIQQTPEKRPNLFGQRDCVSTPSYDFAASNIPSPITPNPKWRDLPSPIMSQLKLFEDRLQSTPISRKIQSQSWINQKIYSVNSKMLEQMEAVFSELDNKLESIEESQKISTLLKQKIFQLIKDFTPKCHNYEERYQKIFSFFLSNFIEIQKNNSSIQSQKNESKQIYRIKERIIGIATVSCEIFNYIHNAISYEFKHHFEVFGTDIKAAIEAFELFELFISDKMSIDLKSYFQNVRKRFLVSDIWQNEQGFKLLFQSQTNSQLIPIRQKIIYQTESRIKQICRQAGIESKIVSKTMNMMNFIFEQKPYLLKNNNIDQIILCCLMSCLSMNEKQGHQTLEILFCQYNSNIQFSFNSNQLGLRDSLGNEMKIVDFYNEIFLEQIQDMLKQNQSQLDEFLLTPVRINKQYSLSNMHHNFNKIKQKPLTGGFLFNHEKGIDRRSMIRKKIIQQNLEMQKSDDKQKEKQDKEQDPPSPTFGLSRHYSFSQL